MFTRRALALGARRVIAIEPGPENLECLRRNLKDEISRGIVTVYPKGVWDRESTLEFHSFPANSAADSFVAGDDQGVTRNVQVTTVDRLAAELNLPRVDFIKLDIKGSTEKAILGASRVLTQYAPRMAISTEEKSDDPARILAASRRFRASYRTECGWCALEEDYIKPMVIFIYP